VSEARGQRPSERGVYVISVVADLAGMHPQTLRMYERRGLIEPKRTSGNSRRYSERDVQKLRRIHELTSKHGLNLEGVRTVMELEAQLEQLQERLERTSRALAEARRELEIERRRAQERRGMLVRLSDVASIFQQTGTGSGVTIAGAIGRSSMEGPSIGAPASRSLGGTQNSRSLGGTQNSRSLGGAGRLEK
jgi:MerR family transcriptional regulator/heat shock protein HspR